jgi:hypothetical protein
MKKVSLYTLAGLVSAGALLGSLAVHASTFEFH